MGVLSFFSLSFLTVKLKFTTIWRWFHIWAAEVSTFFRTLWVDFINVQTQWWQFFFSMYVHIRTYIVEYATCIDMTEREWAFASKNCPIKLNMRYPYTDRAPVWKFCVFFLSYDKLLFGFNFTPGGMETLLLKCKPVDTHFYFSQSYHNFKCFFFSTTTLSLHRKGSETESYTLIRES